MPQGQQGGQQAQASQQGFQQIQQAFAGVPGAQQHAQALQQSFQQAQAFGLSPALLTGILAKLMPVIIQILQEAASQGVLAQSGGGGQQAQP
jgi:hypothetical protein